MNKEYIIQKVGDEYQGWNKQHPNQKVAGVSENAVMWTAYLIEKYGYEEYDKHSSVEEQKEALKEYWANHDDTGIKFKFQ